MIISTVSLKRFSSLLVFTGFLSLFSECIAQQDYSRIYLRFFQNKSLLTGGNKLVFNQKIERLGRVNPYLIPGFIRFVNKYQSFLENPDFQNLDRILRLYEARYNRDLRRELSDLKADNSIPAKKKWIVEQTILTMMAKDTLGMPEDTTEIGAEQGDAFLVVLFMSKNPDLTENPGTNYTKIADSLGKAAVKRTITGFKAAKLDPSVKPEQITASWTNSWFWRNLNYKEANPLPERLFRLLAQRESWTDYFVWLKSNNILKRIDPVNYHPTLSLSLGSGYFSEVKSRTYTREILADHPVSPFKSEHKEGNYTGYGQISFRWTDSGYPLNSISVMMFISQDESPLSHAGTWSETPFSITPDKKFRDDYKYSFQFSDGSVKWSTFGWGILLPAFSWNGLSVEGGFISRKSTTDYKGTLSYSMVQQRVEISTGRIVYNYTPQKDEMDLGATDTRSETQFAYRIQWQTPWYMEASFTGTSGFWMASAGLRFSTP